jgi:LPPG:FO 2-phospho-L-lactate transferase
MAELGLEVSAAAVAHRYAGLIDGFVIDLDDAASQPPSTVRFFSAATLMSTADDRLRLAQVVLQAADALASVDG